jgi:hypothetical protein
MLDGCEVIEGATTPPVTVRVAELLVADPAAFVATQWNNVPMTLTLRSETPA